MTNSKPKLVFVYGTLKNGLSNSHLLKNATFVGNAYTIPTYRMFSVGFPIIRENMDGASVYGEVYSVSEDEMRRLDALEAEGHMYDRKTIQVVYTEGSLRDVIENEVFVYEGRPEYWDRHTPAPYTSVNHRALLEWHP